jgi:hypothetical protein
MAFTATIIQRDMLGATEVVIGKYVNAGGSTGGDIKTGFNHVLAAFLQPWGTAATGHVSPVNESFPLNGSGAVTIVTTANESGSFEIYGN